MDETSSKVEGKKIKRILRKRRRLENVLIFFHSFVFYVLKNSLRVVVIFFHAGVKFRLEAGKRSGLVFLSSFLGYFVERRRRPVFECNG
jgi:hypothetical protein